MKRPVGVTILAILAIIYGVFSLLLALLGLLGSALLASGVGNVKYTAATLAYATITDAVIGILYLVFGIGALSLKRWAWITGIVALVVDVVRQTVGVIMHGFSASSSVGFIITVVVAIVALWYLFRPNVRAAFGFVRAA